MKSKLETFFSALLLIFLLPICLLVLLAILLYKICTAPFAMYRYHRTPYYRDFHEKYSLFLLNGLSGIYIDLYNRGKEKELPIELYKQKDFFYLVRNDQVFLIEAWDGYPEEKEGVWICYPDYGEEAATGIPIEQRMEADRKQLLSEHQDLPIRYLYFLYGQEELRSDSQIMEKAMQCPYYVFSPSEKEWLEAQEKEV